LSFARQPAQVIDEDEFRFDMFVLLIEEWLRRKLRVRLLLSVEVNEWGKMWRRDF